MFAVARRRLLSLFAAIVPCCSLVCGCAWLLMLFGVWCVLLVEVCCLFVCCCVLFVGCVLSFVVCRLSLFAAVGAA